MYSVTCKRCHPFNRRGLLTFFVHVPLLTEAIGTDGVNAESVVENKVVSAEETEAASKFVASEDMEVIDDLEEGSEGGDGSNDSGEEDFSEADEGSVSPSSSGSSKSESGLYQECSELHSLNVGLTFIYLG